jgi:general L-amino acid transport system substrate-binding protein
MRQLARLSVALVIGLVVGVSVAASPACSATLEQVVERGFLRCGVSVAAGPGLAAREAAGRWQGFDVDYCRAVAAAVLADEAAVRVRALEPRELKAALAAGELDLVALGLAWTAARDADGLTFPAVALFTGQGFLVPRALGVRSALELDGARVCVRTGTPALARLDRFFTAHLMGYTVLTFHDEAALFAAYEAQLCEAVSADLRRLGAGRSRLAAPADHVVLPELVAKTPLGLAVAEGDPRWAEIVRWVHVALLWAEASGLDRATAAASTAGSGDAAAPRLAVDARVTTALGLSPGWQRRAVAAVGHYGQMFERHLGPATAVGLQRGPNALQRDGGLHDPLPWR